MYFESAYIKLYIPYSLTLKDKRQVLRSILSKVKNTFNVAISELEELNNPKIIVIGIVTVSNSRDLSIQMIDEVIHFIENNYDYEYIDVTKEEL